MRFYWGKRFGLASARICCLLVIIYYFTKRSWFSRQRFISITSEIQWGFICLMKSFLQDTEDLLLQFWKLGCSTFFDCQQWHTMVSCGFAHRFPETKALLTGLKVPSVLARSTPTGNSAREHQLGAYGTGMGYDTSPQVGRCGTPGNALWLTCSRAASIAPPP